MGDWKPRDFVEKTLKPFLNGAGEAMPTEYRVPNSLDPGMVIAITKAAARPWWAFWRLRQVCTYHTVVSQSGQTFVLDDGSTITLPSGVYP